jgi:cytochrome c
MTAQVPALVRWLACAGLAALCGPLAAADQAMLARGEQLYGRCLACHAIEQHRTGPAHCGLFGRKAGTAAGFESYSPAMKRSGIVWQEASLARFLADPMTVVPGTTMTYQGIADPGERAALVAWMRHAGEPGKACKPPR